jgi:hypothetical protein
MKKMLKLASLHSERLSKEEKTKISGGAEACGCICRCYSNSGAACESSNLNSHVGSQMDKGGANALCLWAGD